MLSCQTVECIASVCKFLHLRLILLVFLSIPSPPSPGGGRGGASCYAAGLLLNDPRVELAFAVVNVKMVILGILMITWGSDRIC